jgi:hypothetical protein
LAEPRAAVFIGSQESSDCEEFGSMHRF